MANIRIKIGAAVDPRIGDQIFAPIVAASQKARAAIRKNLQEGASGGGNPYRTAATVGRDPEVAIVKQRARDLKAAHREIEQDLKRHSTEQQKIAREMQRQDNRAQRIADSAALRVSGGAVRNMGAAVGRGMGVASDLAKGAGVDFSLGGALKSRMELEKGATALSNSGYIKGDKRNGSRVGARDLMEQTQKVAIANGADSADVMAGLQAFTAKTGDLQTAREVIADLAMVAKATGSSMEDLVSAAGDVSSSMGDIENKGPNISAVLRTWAGQGKLGAIELKDLAKSGATLGAAAAKIGGSRTDALGEVGAIVQVARSAQGGNKSAPQAATALSSLMATFDKGARSKEFDKAGVQTRNADNSVRSLEDIIVDSLDATKGDPKKMQKMFADTRARSAVQGFESIYRDAGGGEKGTAAVRAKFKEFKQGAAMGDQELKDSHAAAMGTGSTKAQVLQEKIKKDLGDALEKAAPNLMKLGEIAGALVTQFGGLVSWAADNPFKAVMGLMAGSIVKSMGSEMMRAGVERMAGGLAGRVGVSGAANTVGVPSGGSNAISNLGAAVAIFATAVSAFSIGAAAIDKAFQAQNNADDKGNTLEADASNAIGRYNRAKASIAKTNAEGGPETPEQAAEMEKAKEELRKVGERVKQAKATAEGPDAKEYVDPRIKAALGVGDKGSAYFEKLALLERLPELNGKMDTMNALLGGELTVNVANMPGGGSPGLDGGGRTDTVMNDLGIKKGAAYLGRNIR